MHSRIIWSCDWSPDGRYFVTSSRDKKVSPAHARGQDLNGCVTVLVAVVVVVVLRADWLPPPLQQQELQLEAHDGGEQQHVYFSRSSA